MKPLFLASRSPRRRDLLDRAGIAFQLLDVEIDEDPRDPLPPRLVAILLAARKSLAGAARVPDGWVLGADTIVVVDGRILGKPAGREEAASMLRALSGRTHEVVTGIALADASTGGLFAEADSTGVTMRMIDTGEVEEYVASREWEGKAGGYAIQETADRFVTALEGSYSNVVGLPMERLEALLRRAGAGGRG